MIRPEHIYGDSRRLFLNVELGCASACTYCYLPTEGFKIGLKKSDASDRIDANLLIQTLLEDQRTTLGPDGTLFSIGCFSEAWDPRNRQATIQIIKALLKFGNPLQMATKRKVNAKDLRGLTDDPDWNGQLSIYISSATITHWKTYEPLTIDPTKRFESFSACNEMGVLACLYIKPLISKITVQDVEKYGAVMCEHKIPAIVGDRFTEAHLTDTSPISKNLYVIHDDESVTMRKELSAYGHVFRKSEDALAYLRTTK